MVSPARKLELVHVDSGAWFEMVQRVWQRWQTMSDAFDVLRSLVTEDGGWFAANELTRSALRDAAKRLCELPVGHEDGPQLVSELDEHLLAAESALLAIDANLEIGTFRRRVEKFPPSETASLRYAALLAGHIDQASERQDRFELLVTKLLSRSAPDGRRAVIDEDEVEAVLRVVCGSSAASTTTRAAALEFFAAATARLETFQKLDQLFEGGFYLDVRGYKYSLRRELVDPEILAAAARLNVAISNKLIWLRERSRVQREDIEERVGREDLRLREIFGRSKLTEPPTQRFERERRRSQAPAPAKTRPKRVRFAQAAHVGPLGKVVATLLFVGLTVALSLALDRLFAENRLTPAAPADLAALSPALLRGGWSSGKAEPAFVGHLDAAQWGMMSASDRLVTAKRIQSTLVQRKVRAAMIFSDARAAIQIEDGRVVLAE